MKKILLYCCIVIALAAGLTACNRSDGHDHTDDHGHDHGASGHNDEHGQDDEGPEPIAITQFANEAMLFMEYPRLIRGQTANFLAHVTVIESGEPVRSGHLVLEYVDPDGQRGQIVAEKPRRDGLFVPQGVFEKIGEYSARIVITSPQIKDVIELKGLTVHPDQASAIAAAEADAEAEPDDAVPFLLEQQWKIGTVVRQAINKTLTTRIEVGGEVQAPPGASSIVSPAVAGRIVRFGDNPLPGVGDRVEAGDVLALIELPLPATDAAALVANRTSIRSTQIELVLRQLDLQTKALEIKRELEQALAKLEFSKGSLDRAKLASERGVGTAEQLAKAEQDSRIAQAEYESAKALEKSYAESSQRLEKVKVLALSSDDSLLDRSNLLALPLIAPISGEIVKVDAVEGEQIDAHEQVFHIIDSKQVWVVAHVSEFDMHRVKRNPGAIVTLPGAKEPIIDILASGGRLANIGAVVNADSRTLPVRFELPNSEGWFRIGMFVDVQVESQTSINAVTIPQSAIVIDNGRPTAYVMLEGETFQKRELALGIRDGQFMEVRSGIAAGEWIATRTAYAIKSAAQNPSSFGHGHAH